VVDGRYRLIGRIGSGGMADVYRAEDTHLGREVALKVLHSRFAQDTHFVERFRREASAAAGLQHPNVVSVFDRGRHGDTYYIAMEYLRGRTLKQVIDADAPLPEDAAIDYAIQMLRAAGPAHARGIVHRDFKPHNAILSDDGRLKVTDFGIARAGVSDITETGSIMGTAQYLSPEQAQGQPVGPPSDLYSIGVILHEMLTGRVPFDGDSAVAIAMQHVTEQPPPLASVRPDASPALGAVLARALAKEPERRFANAEEFITALEEARGVTEGVTARYPAVVPAPLPLPEPEPGPLAEERRRSWWPVALLLLGLALLIGFLLLRPDQAPVPDVVGDQLAQARAELDSAGFGVDVVRVRDKAPEGEVVDQKPGGGDRAAEGTVVELEVSQGPGQRSIPPVEGLRSDRAVKRLNRAGFKVDLDELPSSKVRKGHAIRTAPDTGTREEVGSRVRLFVSSGPRAIRVPDVVGLSRASAESRLQEEGFDVVVEERESDQPAGEVLDQDPDAGTEVDEGSRVTITISKPEAKAQVPRVVGMASADAQASLRSAGFAVAVVERTVAEQSQDGIVTSQRPAGGQEVRKGATVRIVVGRYTEPPVEPEPPPVDP